MNKQDFINAIKRGALEGYRKYKVLPSLTMSQAILESGWGAHHIQNNLFGIKAGNSWKGKVAVRATKEFSNGKWITINAKFRAYNNFSESIEDHARLLGENKRYRKVTLARDYRTACLEVWKAGYATDPSYPQKLIKIIEQNKLYEYDKKEEPKMDKKIDNNPSSWAKESWTWAKKEGITDGSNPKGTATREEVIAMIRRAVK